MAAEHVIDIVIQTQDNVSAGLDRATNKLRGFEKSLEKTQMRLKGFAKADYEVVLRAIDRVTPAGSKIRSTLRSLTGRTYNATIGAIDRSARKVREVQARLTALTSKAWMVTIAAKNTISEKAKGAVNGAVQSVTGMGAQMIAGAGIGYGIYDTIRTYKDFQQQMSTVSAISGATGSELDALTAKAKEMGATTSFSATEAGKAFEYMAMAGWKSEDMIAGISGIMNLAAASGEELGRVSDIVTDALTAFGLKASDSAHFADVLAQAATNSNTNVGMMGYTFKYAAPIAGALGYSIEDVGVAIGLMANAGIKGEQAGTSLRKIFSSIASPADQAVQILDEWGISATDASGKVKPLLGTLKELRQQFKGLTQTEQLKKAYSLVGEEAKSGFLAMMNASDADFHKLVDALNNADGAAQKMADIRLDNLAGDMKLLASVWESFQLSIMEGKGADGLRSFVQGVSKDVERLTEYLKDGFDLSDIGRLAMDILTQLKDKFLELDGVGSLLAGGTLAAGLYKIVQLAEKAGKFVKEASAGSIPGKAADSMGEAAAHLKSMVVHAQSVVVNGGTGSGAAGIPGSSSAASPKGGKAPSGTTPKNASRIGRGAKMLGRAAAVAGLAFGAYEAYNVYQENKQLAEKAQYNVDAAQEQGGSALDEAQKYQAEVERQNTNRLGASVGSTGGMLAGGFAGAKAGAVIGGSIGALFGGVGAAPGAAIGGAIGGIGGAIAGTELGGLVGGSFAEISDAASSVWADITSGASNAWRWISDGASQAVQYVSSQWSGFKDYMRNALSPVRMAVEDVINVVVGLGAVVWGLVKPYWDDGAAFISSVMQAIGSVVSSAWQYTADAATDAWVKITEQASAMWTTLCTFFAPAGAWFWGSVWQPIADYAVAAWNTIRALVGTAWDAICSVWEIASAWFDETVWQPITNAVDSMGTSIADAFQSAYQFVTGLFSSLGGWFEEHVAIPVREKFEALRSIGAGITGLSGSSGGSEAPHAAGGLFFAPHQGIVAENGPEAIIPMNDRNRGIDILERAATMMGLNFSADEDFVSSELGVSTPLSGSVSGSNAPQSVSIDMGGISIPITISGGSMDTQGVIQAIRENLEDIADDIGGQLADKVAAIFGNQPVMNAG